MLGLGIILLAFANWESVLSSKIELSEHLSQMMMKMEFLNPIYRSLC